MDEESRITKEELQAEPEEKEVVDIEAREVQIIQDIRNFFQSHFQKNTTIEKKYQFLTVNSAQISFNTP